jgi:hypothetical protein
MDPRIVGCSSGTIKPTTPPTVLSFGMRGGGSARQPRIFLRDGGLAKNPLGTYGTTTAMARRGRRAGGRVCPGIHDVRTSRTLPSMYV